MAFEHPFGSLMDGDITATTLVDPGPKPTTIIKVTDPFTVRVSWYVEGLVVPFINGEWKLKVHFEEMGAGNPEGMSFPPQAQAISLYPPTRRPRDDRYEYEADVAVPAVMTLGVTEGSYKLVTVLTYAQPDGTPGEMAGFKEGPIVQFYTPA